MKKILSVAVVSAMMMFTSGQATRMVSALSGVVRK